MPSYDGKCNLASSLQVLTAGNRTTTYSYNHDHQVTDIAYASGRVDRFRYNAAGRLTDVGDALKKFVHYGFDVPGNTSTASAERNVPVLSGSTPVANVAGQFASTEQFDSLRRPLMDLGTNGQQLAFGYDSNSNLKSATDGTGRVTSYNHEAQDRLTKLTAPDAGITLYNCNTERRLATVQDARLLSTAYSYNGLGQLLCQTSPDSGTMSTSYDSAGRVLTQPPATVSAITAAWGKLGRLPTRIRLPTHRALEKNWVLLSRPSLHHVTCSQKHRAGRNSH